MNMTNSKARRRWTAKHQAVALSQGWDLFDYDGLGFLQLQKVDGARVFLSDAGAYAHVEAEAAKGCKTAALALELDTYFSGLIYARTAA
jgi:hypothetical protein